MSNRDRIDHWMKDLYMPIIFLNGDLTVIESINIVFFNVLGLKEIFEVSDIILA